jgi:hypothetical protein
MAARIGNLHEGDQINLKFHGSKQLGNAPYTLKAVFNGYSGSREDLHALFNVDSGNDLEVYRYGGRWAYGTSAERVTVVS